jgi:hypothetical protein
MVHERVECYVCDKAIISCRCPGPHRVRYSVCGMCVEDGRRQEKAGAVDGIRKEQADQAATATEAQATETGPWTVVGVPVHGPLAAEFSLVLQQYGQACSGVKAALLKHGTEPELYTQARTIKEGRYTECMSVFDRVLAHIGVRAP